MLALHRQRPAPLATALCALALVISACNSPADEAAAPEPAAPSPAEEPVEATSLLGIELRRPDLTDATRARLEGNLAAAQAEHAANPENEDTIIWLGRRLAYLSRYHEAIDVFTEGIELFPDSYRLRRHRGHRYISTRQLDLAVADLATAAELAAGHEDQIEPDGAPNARGIPLGTDHFNIWYHLALALYLQGDFDSALAAYEECMAVSGNPDLLVATSDWMVMTLRRLGREAETAPLLDAITADMEIIENDSYHRRLLMYKGELATEDLLDLSDAGDPDQAVNLATQGYGVGNWYLTNGDEAHAIEVYERILEGSAWAAFGYIAAEADLARLRGAE